MRRFGTNGIREIVGSPLSPEYATAFASAVSAVFPVGAPIAVGWDGRTSSPGLVHVVVGTLLLRGHRVIELGLLPTPAIQYSVPRTGSQLGVIVTASHNPPEFNGFKCVAADGLEIPRTVEERIESAMEAPRAPSATYDRLGSSIRDDGGVDRYLAGILQRIDAARVARRKLRLVLDCANGASVVTSPALLHRLGARVASLNGHIDGTFPGRPSEPTEANLSDLLRTVPSVGAELGIAHDGDADRAAFVDARGRFVPGEKILTLLARDRVARAGSGIVVTPVTGSRAVEEAIAPFGGKVMYTRVGSPSVTHAMQESGAVFGGEENGGLIFPEHQLARDGAMTAAALLDLLAREERPLDQLVEGLPRYSMVKLKVDCPISVRDQVLERLTAELRAEWPEIVTLDGVKAIGPDAWILVRPSGTEPLIRIFAEARDAAEAQRLAEDGRRRVEAAAASAWS